jgi:hypothetical protein
VVVAGRALVDVGDAIGQAGGVDRHLARHRVGDDVQLAGCQFANA